MGCGVRLPQGLAIKIHECQGAAAGGVSAYIYPYLGIYQSFKYHEPRGNSNRFSQNTSHKNLPLICTACCTSSANTFLLSERKCVGENT